MQEALIGRAEISLHLTLRGTMNILTSCSHHYNYGAGRRICPGMHLAERNMWRIAAKLLWAFEFSEHVDRKTGIKTPLDADAYNPGILQAPLPFKIAIKPRSQEHVMRITQEMKDAVDFLKQYS